MRERGSKRAGADQAAPADVDDAGGDQPRGDREGAGARERQRRGQGKDRDGGDDRDAERGQKRAERGFEIAALPGEARAEGHEDEQRDEDRREGDGEERWADRNLLAGERVEQQRIERADKHAGHRGDEEDVVQEKRGLAAFRLELRAAFEARRAPGETAPGRRRWPRRSGRG